MNICIPMTDEELAQELDGLADWPWAVEDLPVGWPYPQVARLLTPHSFVVCDEKSRSVVH